MVHGQQHRCVQVLHLWRASSPSFAARLRERGNVAKGDSVGYPLPEAREWVESIHVYPHITIPCHSHMVHGAGIYVHRHLGDLMANVGTSASTMERMGLNRYPTCLAWYEMRILARTDWRSSSTVLILELEQRV